MATTTSYLFDNATDDAKLQVKLLAQILDPHTEQVLWLLEDEADNFLLDLGSGGGTIAHFMTGLLQPDQGHVEVIDVDARHIAPHERIQIREVDVATAELGEGVYDLIHARLFFMHQPDREKLLGRVVRALTPGGCLVVSDWDCTRPQDMLTTASPELAEAFVAFQRALVKIGELRGMDAGWARRIPDAMRAAGLVEVSGQVYNPYSVGGDPAMLLHACNSRQLEDRLLDAGVLQRQLDVLREGMNDPAVTGFTYPMYTGVGYRPR